MKMISLSIFSVPEWKRRFRKTGSVSHQIEDQIFLDTAWSLLLLELLEFERGHKEGKLSIMALLVILLLLGCSAPWTCKESAHSL